MHRDVIYQKTNGRCFYCGRELIFGTQDNPSPINGYTVDHMMPGDDHPSNKVPACRSCNAAKGNKTVEGFRRARMAQLGMTFTAAQLDYWESRGVLLPQAETVKFWFENGQDDASTARIRKHETRIAIKEHCQASDHKEFIEGWSKSFLEAWGTPYQFNGGRDGRAVKELVAKNITVPELLKNAQIAWKVHKTNPKTWNCGQAATIHGFKERLMNIITEIAANKPPKALADKELDRISAL